MKKFRITVPTTVWMSVDIRVNKNEINGLDREELKDFLINKAYEGYGFTLTGYYGNGGMDKLVGVSEPNISIYPAEEVSDREFNEAEVEEIGE